MDRDSINSVLRSLRRVNLQGSFFGQTVAIRFGLSESDIETLEALIDLGATTAGRLADLTGLTSGAVTRVIDRLEQSGYVRRVPDPADRRRVIVEVVPDKVAAIQSTLNRVGAASADEIGRYSDAQLALITDFLTRMEQITRDEATNLREHPEERPASESTSEHSAPLGGLTSATLLVRSGLSEVRLRPGRVTGELYRAEFEGATPQVRLRDGRVIVQYRGLPFDWRKRKASLGLNTTIPWVIEIVGGVGRVEADLRAVEVSRFELKGGTERVQLELGTPRDQASIRIRRWSEHDPDRTAGRSPGPPDALRRVRPGRDRRDGPRPEGRQDHRGIARLERRNRSLRHRGPRRFEDDRGPRPPWLKTVAIRLRRRPRAATMSICPLVSICSGTAQRCKGLA